jgi:hypothetical protein
MPNLMDDWVGPRNIRAFLLKVGGLGSLISLKAVTDQKIFYLNQTAVHL